MFRVANIYLRWTHSIRIDENLWEIIAIKYKSRGYVFLSGHIETNLNIVKNSTNTN